MFVCIACPLGSTCWLKNVYWKKKMYVYNIWGQAMMMLFFCGWLDSKHQLTNIWGCRTDWAEYGYFLFDSRGFWVEGAWIHVSGVPTLVFLPGKGPEFPQKVLMAAVTCAKYRKSQFEFSRAGLQVRASLAHPNVITAMSAAATHPPPLPPLLWPEWCPLTLGLPLSKQ